MNSLLERMRSGEKIVGTWLQSGSPAVAETLDGYFDVLCIDAEHTPVNIETEAAIMRAVRKTPVLVRLHAVDYAAAKMRLDLGAAGVIAPMVESASDAKEIMDACRYPNRGLGFCRANDYGKGIDVRYEGVAVMQIETKRGMNNIDEILACRPDAVMIGVYDMCTCFGITTNDPLADMMCHFIINACSRVGIPVGLHVIQADELGEQRCAVRTLDEWQERCSFMAYSSDLIMMRREAMQFEADRRARA